MAVSRVAFYRAVADGDLALVQAYWAQPLVRADVLETDAYIVSTRPQSPEFQRDGAFAWFYTQEPWDPYAYRAHYPEFLLQLAFDNDHAHIVEWLFHQHDSILATLVLLLPRALAGARAADPSIAEALLTSHLFQNLLSNQAQQLLLDEAIRFPERAGVVQVLVAHGACVNTTIGRSPLVQAEMTGATQVMELLIALGADYMGVGGVDM